VSVGLAGALAVILVAAAGGTALVRRLARRHGVIDVPGHRSSHEVPTPRGGGVAIVVSAISGVTILWVFQVDTIGAPALAVLAGAAAMGVLGFWDDLKSLPASVRLAVQLAAALLFALFGARLDNLWLPFFGEHSLGWAAAPVTALAIAALTNFYNFMDGIDGLAGGQAVLFGGFFAAFAFAAGDPALGLACLGVAAAAGGFLIFNFPPASIFMGDSGSLFLGFFFAATAVALAAKPDPAPPFALCLLVMLTFVFDPAYTLIRRVLRGEKPHHAHRSHLYQRLNILGFRHLPITLGEYALTIMLGATAWLTLGASRVAAFACLLWSVGFVGIALWVERSS